MSDLTTPDELREEAIRLSNLAYYAKEAAEKAENDKDFADALERCRILNEQGYWEVRTSHNSEYNEIEILNLYFVKNLKPGWWNTLCNDGGLRYAEIKISGHVEHIMLPILPTLISNKTIEPKARGMYGDIPRYVSLKVKNCTQKEAKRGVPCWFNYPNNLIIPFTITGSPILSFNEDMEYFKNFTPTTQDRFNNGVKLILEFVQKSQEMYKYMSSM